MSPEDARVRAAAAAVTVRWADMPSVDRAEVGVLSHRLMDAIEELADAVTDAEIEEAAARRRRPDGAVPTRVNRLGLRVLDWGVQS